MGSALLAGAAVESYYSYIENREALIATQRAKAQGAAAVISRFLDEIEGQLGWATHAAIIGGESALEQRRLDFLRLLRQAPAITDLAYIDADGREQLRVSRVAMDAVGTGTDRSGETAWSDALAHGRFIGPVYFRHGSEPYLTLAIPERGRRAGVVLAEVNLKFILDVVSRVDVGPGGVAYAVDGRGLLIAHPDIGLVLRRTDLSHLEQVQAALSSPTGIASAAAAIASDWTGRRVLSAHAPIDVPGWQVFVEQPLAQAFEPIRESLVRTALIAVIGLTFAALAAYWMARRMVVPIRLLADGAARIGAGDLDHRIELGTGDELEALAQAFDGMRARLKESYSGLESMVAERTNALGQALKHQTATSEVLGVISRSPDDSARALATIAASAAAICEAYDAVVILRRGDVLVREAHHGPIPAILDQIPLTRGSVNGRAAIERRPIHVPDILAAAAEYPEGAAMARELGHRTILCVPLLRDDEAIGTLMLRRFEVSPFSDAHIRLLETFADQAVIAIENARLFRAIEEKSRQIEIASQHKSQFLANMSHELRTPLNAILGYAELMQDGVYGALGPKLDAILERVQANGRHLLGLINDVLDLSKIEAGQLELRLQDYSLADVVQTVVQSTESLAREKGLALEASVPADLPVARGDERRIAQVLLNLVGNAIKFTDEGRVRVSVRAKPSKFVIEVSDTGRGIPEPEQQRIFEEFHQVDSSNTKEKGGTGLGLAIARRILLLHGARISVHSSPGAGATFRVDLPIRVETQRRAD